MSRLVLLSLGLMMSLTAFAQDLSIKGFNDRFALEKNAEGKVVVIKLKKAVTKFTLKPFLDQIKSDLTREQGSFLSLTASEKEAQIDQLMADLGYSSDKEIGNSAEAQKIKESLLNIPNIDLDQTFVELNKGDFWKEFERRFHEAMLFIDPTVVANLDDARFFYKRNVTYKVIEWALQEAQKRFSNVPVLNMAAFVIIRVHNMMLEQRMFHHNMLLYYFENVPETQLGMTKEEVDRAVSSIYEYRIEATNIFESNRAAQNWLNYGMDNFYRLVRTGNTTVRDWQSIWSDYSFTEVKKINFAFASVTENNARKIYHLHVMGHMFSMKPALAYDYSNPKRVQRNRSLLNIAGLVVGFIPMSQWLKGNVDNFIKSFYVQQVRMEGSLVGYFEATGDTKMMNEIYDQRSNFYIVR